MYNSRNNWVLLLLFTLPLLGCSKQGKLDGHLKRAEATYAKKDYETARLEYKNAFQLDPDNGDLAARLGEIFYNRGEPMLAYQYFNRAKELQPTNSAVRVKLASLFTTAGEYEKAKEEAEFVLKSSPDNPAALLVLVIGSNTTNEIGALIKRIEPIVARQPTNAELHLALGQLHQKGGHLKNAEASFHRVAALDPKDPRAPHALGEIYWRQRDTNRAGTNFKLAVDLAPLKSAQRTRYAEFLLAAGRTSEAKQFMEHTIAEAPDFISGLNLLAELALRENDFPRSSNYIASVIEIDSINRDALLKRARLKMLQGDYKVASEELDRLSKLYSTDAVIQYHLAEAYRGSGDVTKALTTLDRAVLLKPNYVEAIFLQSELLLSRGDAAGAIPRLLELTSRFPQLPNAHFLLASAYWLRGTPQEALSACARATSLYPKDAKPLYLAGVIHRQQKNSEFARQAFESVLRIDPEHSAALDHMIELTIEQKDFSGALSRLEPYMVKYPENPMLLLLQSKVYTAQQQFQKAEAPLLAALKRNPEFYSAHKALIDLYIISGQQDRAISRLESGLANKSEDPSALLQLALLHESKNNFDKAIGLYRKLVALRPRSLPALNNLAYLLSEKKNTPSEALPFAKIAREISPNDPSVADTFGWITYRLGDYSHALAVLQQAADKLSSQPEALYHLGMGYYMNGLESQARAALDSASQSSTEFPGKQLAVAALATLNVKPSHAHKEILQKALSKNPNDLFALIRLAEVAEHEKNWERAAAHYETAMKVNPKVPQMKVRLATLNIEKLNNKSKGLQYAREAWGALPGAQIASVLGPVGVKAGDYVWAMPLLEQAHRADSSDMRISYYLGLSYYSRYRLIEASRHLEQSVTKIASTPEANKAALLLRLVQLDLSPTNTLQHIDIGSVTTDDPAFSPALFASARLAEQDGKTSEARDLYKSIVDSDPEFVPAQRQLALLSAEDPLQDATTAGVLSKLRIHFPNDLSLKKASGKIAYRKGDYRDAIRFLKESLVESAPDADLLYHLGMAQFHLKDAQAKETLTKAQKVGGTSRLAKEANQALTNL